MAPRKTFNVTSPPRWTVTPKSGLTVTPEMRQLMSVGVLNAQNGGQRFRYLYSNQSIGFRLSDLSLFAQACFYGAIDAVQGAIKSKTPPDLAKVETAFEQGYASYVIIGSQRVPPDFNGQGPPTNHLDCLKFLVQNGAPLDSPDIGGHTALHHVVLGDSFRNKEELIKTLLEGGANINAQNRWGEPALLMAMARGDIQGLEVLLEAGADVNVKDGDGSSCTSIYPACGPLVVATVEKWLKIRGGEKAPLMEDKCDNCGASKQGSKSLQKCSGCLTVQYCSKNCQRAAWREHKSNCQRMDQTTTVTVKPHYRIGMNIPLSPLARVYVGGLPTRDIPANHLRSNQMPTNVSPEGKQVVVKIQVPLSIQSPDGPYNDLYLYTRKRDIVCHIKRQDSPQSYDRIPKMIQTKGVNGQKGYFVADYRSPEELVIKVSEILAAQPW